MVQHCNNCEFPLTDGHCIPCEEYNRQAALQDIELKWQELERKFELEALERRNTLIKYYADCCKTAYD